MELRSKPIPRVLSLSTDYWDFRKAAFQQYSVASDFNVCRLPWNVSVEPGAATGVTFVSAILALAICLGLDFSTRGPNLLHILRTVKPLSIPEDARDECLNEIEGERPRRGDLLAIWGGASHHLSIIRYQLCSLFDRGLCCSPTCQSYRIESHLYCGCHQAWAPLCRR